MPPKKLMASDLASVLMQNMRQGDYQVNVYDSDTDTEYEPTSVRFETGQDGSEWLSIVINETPETAQSGQADWAIDVPDYGAISENQPPDEIAKQVEAADLDAGFFVGQRVTVALECPGPGMRRPEFLRHVPGVVLETPSNNKGLLKVKYDIDDAPDAWADLMPDQFDRETGEYISYGPDDDPHNLIDEWVEPGWVTERQQA